MYIHILAVQTSSTNMPATISLDEYYIYTVWQNIQDVGNEHNCVETD